VEVSAKGKNVRVSPRKVRLILKPLKGRSIDDAVSILRNVNMPIARKVEKIVKSAAANAENNYQMDPRFLKVVAAYAGDGLRLKRWRARARGRASRRVRRRAHITVVVEEMEG